MAKKVTIQANSSNGPIEYSIWQDGVMLYGWQASNEFTVSETGDFEARTRDAQNCEDEFLFFIYPFNTVYYGSSEKQELFYSPTNIFNESSFGVTTGDEFAFYSVDIDEENNLIFVCADRWTDIYKAPLSGGSFTNITNTTGSSSAPWTTGLWLDKTNQKIYATSNKSPGGVEVFDYQGNNIETFSGGDGEEGISVDLNANKIIYGVKGVAVRVADLNDFNTFTDVLNDNTVFDVNLDSNKIFYRDLNSSNIIRSVNYDGSNDSLFIDMGEPVLYIRWKSSMPDFIHVSTGSGLYTIEISNQKKTQILSTDRINEFDLV